MKAKTRKRVLSVAMAVMMLAGLTACGEKDGGNSEAKTDDGKTIVTMSYWNPKETVRPFLDLVEEKLPDIELQYNYTALNTYSNGVRTKLISGNGDDIVAFDNTEIPPLARQGILGDLTDITKDFEFSDVDYVDGKVYLVPMNTWYDGIYYNKDIFEEHNIQVPTTFEELLDACEKLDNAGVKPFTIGASSGGSLFKTAFGYIEAEYIFQDEGKDFNAKLMKGEASLAESITPYLEQWSEIVKRGYINKVMLGISKEQAIDEFAVGQAAMYPSGTYAYETFKQKNPNLNFGIMPYMGSTADKTALFGGLGGGYCLNARSKNKEAAMKVLELMASPEGQQALCQGNPGSYSQLKDAKIDLPEEFELVRDTLEAGRVLCMWDEWGTSTAEGTVSNSLQALLLDPDLDLKAELEKADSQIATYLKSQQE